MVRLLIPMKIWLMEYLDLQIIFIQAPGITPVANTVEGPTAAEIKAERTGVS